MCSRPCSELGFGKWAAVELLSPGAFRKDERGIGVAADPCRSAESDGLRNRLSLLDTGGVVRPHVRLLRQDWSVLIRAWFGTWITAG